MEEVGGERLGEIVAQPEAEDVLVERQHVVDLLAVEHRVTHAERAGAEAGDGAAGLERIGGGLGAVRHFEAVADRIVEHDQVLDLALLGERARAARERNLVLLQVRGEGVERGGVGDLPAVEAGRVDAVLVNHETLLAVVHAERRGAPALVDQLHAEEPAGVGRPVFQVLGAKADIAQRLQAHRRSPAGITPDLRGLYHARAALRNNSICPAYIGWKRRISMVLQAHRPGTCRPPGVATTPSPMLRRRAWASAQFGRMLALRSAEDRNAASQKHR